MKTKISEKLRKKHGACSHNQVSYKSMEKLVDIAFKRSKIDSKIIKNLSHRIQQDGKVLINDIQLKNDKIKKLETLLMIGKTNDEKEKLLLL